MGYKFNPFSGKLDVVNAKPSVANEATDTTCFPIFNPDATGTFAPKTNAGLTFDSSTAELYSTNLSSKKLELTGVTDVGTIGTELIPETNDRSFAASTGN